MLEAKLVRGKKEEKTHTSKEKSDRKKQISIPVKDWNLLCF